MPEFDSLKGVTMDNRPYCMAKIEGANSKSLQEYNQETVMTRKGRVSTIAGQRNGLPMTSLGDKNYKNPDYTPDFFKEGGLVAGST